MSNNAILPDGRLQWIPTTKKHPGEMGKATLAASPETTDGVDKASTAPSLSAQPKATGIGAPVIAADGSVYWSVNNALPTENEEARRADEAEAPKSKKALKREKRRRAMAEKGWAGKRRAQKDRRQERKRLQRAKEEEGKLRGGATNKR